MSGVLLAVHGGAGSLEPGAPGERGRRHALAAALRAGRALLVAGASALDAVELVTRRLETHPLFNAGRGSVLNRAGFVEMDATIASGSRGASGAVCAVRRLAHPVSAARLVMERSRHVLLCGAGAEAFAAAAGAELVDPRELVTPERREQLERARSAGDVGDTVGAVARDRAGRLAAATSTGGRFGKLPGRVSDSALVGCGTWARDETCAVSLSGHGEVIIRSAVAHELDARMRWRGESLGDAAGKALERAVPLGGGLGLIALDRSGHLGIRFDTPAFQRGWIGAEGEPVVRIFAGE